MKTKKRLSTFGLIIAILMMIMTFFQPFVVLADDNESQTGDGGDGGNAGKVSGTWCTDSPGTGTRYTIKIDGQEIVLDLDAGKTIAGSENVKGYQTTGYDNLDDHGSAFDLPEDKLILEREDWAAIATAAGKPEIAEKILDSSSSFDGFVEQYLWCGHQDYMWNSSSGWNWKKRTATELKALQNNSSTPARISSIGKCIETSYNAFREESDLYDDYMGLKGYNTENGQGWGGYKYEPEEVPPPPPPPPPEEEEPDPEPTDPYVIVEVSRDENTGYDASAKIDDTNEVLYIGNVAEGDPIPTSEKLVVTGKTNLGGTVEGLKFYEVQYDTEYEYSYTVSWEVQVETFQGYRKYSYWSGDELITDFVLDEDGEKIPIYGYERYDSGSKTVTQKIGGENVDDFIKVTSDTKVNVIESTTVENPTLPSVTFPIDVNGRYTVTRPAGVTADDNTRVSGVTSKSTSRTVYRISKDSSEDPDTAVANEMAAALYDAQNFMDTATFSDFWDRVETDVLRFHSNKGSVDVTANGTVQMPNYYYFVSDPITVSTSLANNSTGAGYVSNCFHTLTGATVTSPAQSGAGETGYTFNANAVKVHTPIFNSMSITSTSNNQLKNADLATSKIVTLGDSFTVTVSTTGTTTYYGFINTAKYITSKQISCGVCGNTINAYTHTCTVPLTKTDNQNYTVTATVVAENGAGSVASTDTNAPDSIGTIKKTDSVYIAGKIYDMQVRTTNDSGWKLSEAQGLAQLPIGEKGDNGNKIYKYAIKLGYKAYFDFKTLGVANKAVDITPKLYYVDANGNVNNNVEFYFKTSPTMYEKLGASDIFLKMSINSTNGEVNNSDFIKEKAITTQTKGGVDFSKVLNIGKLGKITLTEENALHTTGPVNELRWYAEVYIPSSLVVAPAGTKLVDVSNGKGVFKTGYVIVTFADVTTKLADGRDYLQYSMVRNYLGNIIDFTNSIMYKEKAESGMFKNTINLSNGKTFSGYAETEIPVIVYDISMRANNDYETEGTH